MLVPREKLELAEQIAAAAAAQTVVGEPFDEATQLGPLVSDGPARARARLHQPRRRGGREARVRRRRAAARASTSGYFVQPTVFSGVTPEMTIAREEIFGPVLAIMPYDDEDDALRIANDSDYGLAGGVYSGSEERAKALARRMRTGQVEINGAAFNPLAPFGGYKQSGNGRELGYGIEEFLVLKSLQL